jgi:hypothetical protein
MGEREFLAEIRHRIGERERERERDGKEKRERHISGEN